MIIEQEQDKRFIVAREPEESIEDSKSFTTNDFKKSGISEKTIQEYVKGGYLIPTADSWQLYYPELYKNIISEYYTKRLKNPLGKNKYIKPSGKASRLFRPLALSHKILMNNDEYIILTEGEKKAIKAVQEGFHCISIGGVWSWKKSVTKISSDNAFIDDEVLDIISDVLSMNWENKTVYLCFDSDLWEKEQVKIALYLLACYLMGAHKARVKIIMLPKGGAKGLDDFLIEKGNDAFQDLMNEAPELKLKEAQDVLMGNAQDKIKFPIDIFPKDLKDLIIDLAKRMDAPIEYIASALIVGASILMDGYYSIDILNDGSWIDYPILWVAIVGGASNKKTPCLSIIKRIIAEIEKELAQDYEEVKEKYKQELIDYKIALEQYKKNKMSGNYCLCPKEPEEPTKQIITSQDITVEALAFGCYKNKGRGIAILIDELASLLKGLGQYKGGKGNDEEYFLQGWKKQLYHVMRKGSECFMTEPSHNILGTIQPKVLEKTLFQDGFETSNGMIERWLFVCTEYEETGEIYSGKKPYDISLIEAIYRRLYNNLTMKCICFSYQAQVLYDNFRTAIVKSKKDPNKTDLMRNYIQKQTDYVARFSLVLHYMFDFGANEISGDTVINAMKLSTYYMSCFKKISNISVNSSSNDLAMTTLNWMRTKGTKQISPSKLFKSNTSRYRSTTLAKITLESLSNWGFGRLEKTQNGGEKFHLYS